MITAVPQPPLDELATQLADIAAAMATADVQNAALAQAGDPMRWRQAQLVWPQFAASLTRNAHTGQKGQIGQKGHTGQKG